MVTYAGRSFVFWSRSNLRNKRSILVKLIILGPPCTGKGTQAEIVAKQLKLQHLSTGEILRKEIQKGTKLGKEIAERIDQGNFVSDEMALQLIKDNLKDDNFILDGYPRTLNQAKIMKIKIDKVIYLKSDKEHLIKRLKKRAKMENRKDDNEDILEQRIKLYNKETKPLLDFYKDKLIIIDGNKEIHNITKDIIEKITNNS